MKVLTTHVYIVLAVVRPDAEKFEEARSEFAKLLARQTERKRRPGWDGVYDLDGRRSATQEGEDDVGVVGPAQWQA